MVFKNDRFIQFMSKLVESKILAVAPAITIFKLELGNASKDFTKQ